LTNHRLRLMTAYAAAGALVAVAAAIRYALTLIDPRILLFASFFPAILLSALLYGSGPAVFALLLSTLTVWFLFMPPYFSFEIQSLAQGINLVFFLASGGLLAWIASAYRTALMRLEQEEEKRTLLVRELQHRNKNALTVAQTIITHTLRSDRAAADALNGRLRALFATNDLLAKSTDETATLSDILAVEFGPFGPNRVEMAGPPVRLGAGLARAFSLIIHELATNAAKYGSLSFPTGRVAVSWRVADGALHLDWKESGGPPIVEPSSTGFGTSLIKTLLAPYEGAVSLHYPPSGAKCGLSCRFAE
jgi:two-component sensor histidine kinase